MNYTQDIDLINKVKESADTTLANEPKKDTVATAMGGN